MENDSAGHQRGFSDAHRLIAGEHHWVSRRATTGLLFFVAHDLKGSCVAMTARTVDSSKDYEPPPSTDEASTMNMGSSNGPVVLQPALFFSLPEPLTRPWSTTRARLRVSQSPAVSVLGRDEITSTVAPCLVFTTCTDPSGFLPSLQGSGRSMVWSFRIFLNCELTSA
jgi:hypothetical protein